MTSQPRHLRLSWVKPEDYSEIIPADILYDHCNIEAADESLAKLLTEVYLPLAVEWFEGRTGRSLIARSHRLVLAHFPYCRELRLPRGKTDSVESIEYTSTSGEAAMLTGPSSESPAGSDYQEDLNDADAGVLMMAAGESWPSFDSDAISPVVINFTAGWQVADIPKDIIHALLFACSDALEIRGAADLTQGVDLAAQGKRLEIRNLLIERYVLDSVY